MTELSSLNQKSSTNIFSLSVILFLNLAFQIILIRITDTSIALVGYCAVLFSIILYKLVIKDLPTFLLLLTIIPFAYIDIKFSRYFEYILFQNIPLYFLALFAIAHFFHTQKSLKIRISYLMLPIVIYSAYSFLLAIYGYSSGARIGIIIEELYQNLYFAFAIPIIYLIIKRKNYRILYITTVIIFTFIAFQYIIIDLLIPGRFATYHNHFFPFVIAIVFSAILFNNRRPHLRISLSLVLGILWWGSIATQTRTLWITNLIAMIVVFLLYLKYRNVNTKYLILLLVTVGLLIIPLLKKTTSVQQDFTNVTTEEKVESLSNPMGDISFLMRVEAIYLGARQIMQKPIFGYGFGYQLQMKWLLQTSYTFPDNNYMYYWLKGGIIFLLIALWMFYRLFKSSYLVFKNSESIMVKFMMVGIIGGMLALMAFAMLNANLVKLKLNLLYALTFAYVDFEYRKIEIT
jgi:hypothetical protein